MNIKKIFFINESNAAFKQIEKLNSNDKIIIDFYTEINFEKALYFLNTNNLLIAEEAISIEKEKKNDFTNNNWNFIIYFL
jgi:hypothetical protein